MNIRIGVEPVEETLNLLAKPADKCGKCVAALERIALLFFAGRQEFYVVVFAAGDFPFFINIGLVRDALRAYVREHQDATQQEIADAFRRSNQTVSKALRRLDITRKKTRRYKEQNPEEVEAYKETLEAFSPEKRAYVDESGFNACYEREYGYAPYALT